MTAVEWLADEIIMLEEKLRLEEININDFMDAKDELVSKALEMENEQKIEFACQVAEASAMKYIQGKTTWQIAEELITIKSE